MKYQSNPEGLREILASPAAANIVRQYGDKLAAQAGDGYEASYQMGEVRQRGIVYAATWSARARDRRENILVRVLG